MHTDQVLYWLLLALAVSLPFEPIQPLVALGFFNVNHLKLLEAAIIVVWLVGLAQAGSRTASLDKRSVWPAAVFLGLAVLSAVFAEAFRADAIRFVGRLASGVFAFLVARQVVQDRPDRLKGLLWAICLGAGASALLGLTEMARWSAVDPLLQVFKVAPTRVGSDLRLSASFQYATIAAVFFEMAAPLAIVLVAIEVDRRRRILAAGIAAVSTAALVLTFTRAGIVALAVAFGLLIVLAFARPRWRRLALPTMLASAMGAVALAVLSLGMRNFESRFASENDWGWYAATYDVPATLTVTPDDATDAVVTARNTGQVVWTAGGPQGFALGYRWLSADAASQLEQPATVLDLPHDVGPGEAVELNVDVATRLPPGEYRLAWGMLQQHVLWFHDRGYPDAETLVRVMGGAAATPPAAVEMEPRSDLTSGLPPVPRADLWRAALQILEQHPLLGVGPDNFRHIYGTYLGLPTWDDRVHANNLYLELLADVGALGALAFGVLVAIPIVGLVRGLGSSESSPTRALLIAGLVASLLAYFLHSGLDSFLEFTPVYMLFWIILGMSAAQSKLDECQYSS
ncbi:MAG TPA: O-antigen ligase family protein [Chloroflexota bacterium]